MVRLQPAVVALAALAARPARARDASDRRRLGLYPGVTDRGINMSHFRDLENKDRPLCPEACAGRDSPNFVVVGFTYHARTSGISDRQVILETQSRLAANLCARLVFHPPCQMILNSHGVSPSCDLDWTDLYQIHDQLGSPLLVRGDRVPPHVAAAIKNITTVLAPKMDSRWGSPNPELRSALAEAVRLRDAGEHFVFRMSPAFYGYDNELVEASAALGLRGLPQAECLGCEAVRAEWAQMTYLTTPPLAPEPCGFGVSPRIAALAAEAARSLGSFDSIHLRIEGGCPHEPRDVQSYMECAEPLRRGRALVFFSDVQTPGYRQGLAALPPLTRDGRRVVDGDALVARVVARDPLCSKHEGTAKLFTYLVGRQVQGLAGTRFNMRRSLCRVTVLGAWAGLVPREERAALASRVRQCQGRWAHDPNQTSFIPGLRA